MRASADTEALEASSPIIGSMHWRVLKDAARRFFAQAADWSRRFFVADTNS